VSLWPITQDGLFRAVAFDAGDHVGALRIESKKLRGNSFAIENVLDIAGDPGLVPRRIGSVHAEDAGVVFESFLVDLVPVDGITVRSNGCAAGQ
jgi:hypothetical protein